MTGGEFWIAALCLSVGAGLVLIRAMLGARPPAPDRAPDIGVYKAQLADIAQDLARGTLAAGEAQRLRVEVGLRLLEADRTQGKGGTVAQPTGRTPRLVAGLVLALTLPGALAVYWLLGAPGYGDMALEARLQALDQAIASRPDQVTELARLGLTRNPATDADLAAGLATQTDPAALRALFRQRLEAGEVLAAIRTQERLIALLGATTNAADHANLALALVVEAQGYVSPEAEAQLRETLTRDMSNELARYLVGEMFLQGGRYDQAFKFWRPIAEGGNPMMPWVATIHERIEDVAALAGVRYTLPETAPRPSSGDVAAAAEMTPEDRQAMIEGMVAQLSDRLETQGGTVEDWGRLIRSLVVLERPEEAQATYARAKTAFEGQAAELSFLKLAAVESGLDP